MTIEERAAIKAALPMPHLLKEGNAFLPSVILGLDPRIHAAVANL
jgi:hypothetical protein